MNSALRLAACAVLAGACTLTAIPSASAADAAVPPPDVAPATRSVQNGIPFITGGVGQDEQNAIRSTASQYNLRMMFVSSRTAEYLSNVSVDIGNSAGTSVFHTRTLGPMLYVALPPGQYKVHVRAGDVNETRTVNVSRGGAGTLEFRLAYQPGL